MSPLELLPQQYWRKLNPIKLFRKKIKKKKKMGIPSHIVSNIATASTVAVAAVEAADMVTEKESESVINYGKVIPIPDMSTIPALDVSEKLAEF